MPTSVASTPRCASPSPRPRPYITALALLLACLTAGGTRATPMQASDSELAQLRAERASLSRELEQYRTTLELLRPRLPGTNREQALNRLRRAAVALQRRLIERSQREVELLQQRLALQRRQSSEPQREQEQAEVARLLQLISRYHDDLQASLALLPSPEESAARQQALRQSRAIDKVQFPSNKLVLSGAEGSTALSRISERLADRDLAETSRRSAPICDISTRLYGTLVNSEHRDLQPVGKHHYVTRLRLQPGATSLQIGEREWYLERPANRSAQDYLLTFYAPPRAVPELHVFPVEELVAQGEAHIPAWLPQQLDIAVGS